MIVPLPTGITGDQDIPRLQENLVNLFNPGDNTLIKTPVITSFSTGEGNCRGAITFQEEHYQVSGTELIKISVSGFKTVLGTIANKRAPRTACSRSPTTGSSSVAPAA